MRFFHNSFRPGFLNSIPSKSDFETVMFQLESLIRKNSHILTCSLWWGSSSTKTSKITSDLDIVFLYPIRYTLEIKELINQMNCITGERNIPLEVMCLPEEFHFGTHNIDLDKILMILEYELLNVSGKDIYICGERGNFTLEKFGFNNDQDETKKILRKSYADYIRHKYERWMRSSCDWNCLNEKEKCHLAGKFISMPAHAMRKLTQAEGRPALSFESNIQLLSSVSDEVKASYQMAERLKRRYLENVESWLRNGNIKISVRNERTREFLDNAMKISGDFILKASKEL